MGAYKQHLMKNRYCLPKIKSEALKKYELERQIYHYYTKTT